MKIILLLLATAACTEPVVEMQLVLPKSESMSAQCITAVEVYANGATFPANKDDFVESCIEVTPGTTYASVKEAIAGKFTLGMPNTGLSTLEIFGWSGPGGCTFDDNAPPPNLMFFGKGEYIGQDTVDLPIVPNLDCAADPVKIRVVDMMALVGGANCTAASNIGGGYAALVTLMNSTYKKGVDVYGGTDGGLLMSGVASFNGHTKVGARSCLGVDGGSMTGGSTGCNVGGGTVCAAAGELEHAYISNDIYASALALDQATLAKFPTASLVSVWSNGATKTPVGGATLEVDPAHAKVFYIDPPAAGQVGLHQRTDNATGASGLALVYADSLVSVTIKAGSTSRTVTLGAPNQEVSANMIVMP
ncbi:MAG TPA: hypothetical protein VMZ53_32360 [Kofleriaceae bacterium]|nr:hypothetical protein [Kofleriaceae bacterium]